MTLENATPESKPEAVAPRRAIVLAGRRSGEDALALAAGADHRALLEIEGEPMLLRVVDRLLGWPSIEHVLINIDEPERLESIPRLVAHRDAGRAAFLRSTESPSRSVLESLDQSGLAEGPLLVTTADHALLDDAMLEAFLGASARSQADLTLGLVSRTTIEARFPEAKRTYLRFRDDAYSGANLFLFRRPAARRVAEFWRTVESERKRPWRIARAFGGVNLLLFVSRRLTLEAAMTRASHVVGAQVEAIPLRIAEAAVDVDKLEDLELVRSILAERRNDRSAGPRGKTVRSA
jgi:GTP:adenosylcobinamide-phosphate guanylyltransferase